MMLLIRKTKPALIEFTSRPPVTLSNFKKTPSGPCGWDLSCPSTGHAEQSAPRRDSRAGRWSAWRELPTRPRHSWPRPGYPSQAIPDAGRTPSSLRPHCGAATMEARLLASVDGGRYERGNDRTGNPLHQQAIMAIEELSAQASGRYQRQLFITDHSRTAWSSYAPRTKIPSRAEPTFDGYRQGAARKPHSWVSANPRRCIFPAQ